MRKTRMTILVAVLMMLTAIQIWCVLAQPKVVINADQSEAASEALNIEQLAADVQAVETEKGEEVILALELVGTAMSNAKDPVAFIKDLDSGKQGIYKLGHSIKEAKIVKIAKGEVDLEAQGKIQTLKLRKRSAQYAAADSAAIVSVEGDKVVMDRNALLQETGNIISSVKNLKVKPYKVSQGVVGMKVEGVARDSLICQAGICDNDVITAVNSQKIDSYQKALQVMHKIKGQQEIKVSLVRNGELKSISYRFSN